MMRSFLFAVFSTAFADFQEDEHLSLLQLRAHALQSATSGSAQQPVCEYAEGRIDNGESPGSKRQQRSEAEAQAACSADETCLGLWNQSGGNWILLWSGNRAWAAGVPNGSVKSVQVKDCSDDEPACEVDPDISYVEGRIDKGDSPFEKRQQRSEAEAQTACSCDETCLGIWNQNTGNWILLSAGNRAWAAGVPNGSVKSVKVKTLPQDEPAAQQPVCENFVEGRVDMGDSPGSKRQQRSEAEAKAACSADETCLGVWNQSSGNWIQLWAGNRAWAAGVPNGSVKSVQVKDCSEDEEDEAAAVGDPHLSLSNGDKRDLETTDLSR